MAMWLRQSTASQEVLLGPFLDDTDGKTAETALTIANTDIKIWKDGGTTESSKNSGGATHIASGRYYAVLDATDTNTLGKLEVNVHVAGALPVRREFMVLSANVYDSLASNADMLQVDTQQIAGTSQTARDIGASVLLSSGTGTGQISLTAGAVTAGTVSDKTGYSLTQTFPANFSSLSISATTGLVDITQTAADKAWSTTTRVLTANTNLNDPTAAAIADAVWDEATSGHVTAGTFGTQCGTDIDAILVDTGTTLETHLTDIKGATFSGATDSLEAIRDRGDAAWVTGGGGSAPQLLQSTTIATLASQTSFTLTAGSADDNAYNKCLAIVTDQSTSTQKAVGFISAYTGSTKTVTLKADPAIFTMAVGDSISIVVANDQEFPDNLADMVISIGTGFVTVGTNNDKTGYEILGTKTTLDDLNDIAATAIVSNGAITTLSGAVVNVDTVDTCTTNTDLVTAASIRAEIDSNSTQLAAILTDTGTTLETHLTDIKGATFSGATDSLEAIRNQGDAAWTTGAGGNPPQLLQSTTIATLATQTNFTLTDGSADNDAYDGAIVVITDQSTSTQKAFATVSGYVGSTKTITLGGTPVFTIAVGDSISIIAPLGAAGSAPTAAAIRAEIDANSTQLAAIVADTNELQTDWANGGRLDLLIDAILADTTVIGADGSGLTALATQTSVDTIATYIDTEVAAILAAVTAIKAKTDSLTFTDAGKVDATMQAAADIKAAVCNKVADHLLRRSLTSALASSDGDTKALRTLAGAVAKLVNKVALSGSTLTIYETDDTTSLGTQTATTSDTANPITALDTN